MERNLKEIIQGLTLEEKAGMCSGKDYWRLKSIARAGIPETAVSDGPNGLRKQQEGTGDEGINESIRSVCYPCACATACSFDRELLETMGSMMGKECQAENVSVLLGPAVNIKRSPLCGRNFEYFSEDPYLASAMAGAQIKGVQKEHVGTSLKHFAANNQEYRRMSVSAEIDERTLREIYLAAFEGAVKEGRPETIMCSYNRINGEFASESEKLLTKILRDEWGFEGYVMSDWGAVNDRVKGLQAGLDLEMPGNGGRNDAAIVEAVKNGTLKEEVLDKAVERILRVIFRFADHRIPGEKDPEKHHETAVKIAEGSAVLLKNEGILPLHPEKQKLAFLGEFVKHPRIQGGGSGHVNASRIESAWETVKDWPDVTYAQGYRVEDDVIREDLVQEAVEKAKAADVAVIFAGLPDDFECESYDRAHMQMPQCQNDLIERVAAVQENLVVVLHNGSPVEMPWIHKVKGVLELYLCGQGAGRAAAELLNGTVNPSGKLAETFPLKLSDTPSWLNFPGNGQTVEYAEGIFMGYRYYDKKEMEVLFPFGHGLSYTDFEYRDLKLSSDKLRDGEELTVSLTVKNTGKVKGKEVIQLYVAPPAGEVMRPVRELRNFAKVELLPQEEKTVEMKIGRRAFAYYETRVGDWFVPSGTYRIQIGASSRDIRLTKAVEVHSKDRLPFKIHWNTTVSELMQNEKTKALIEPMLRAEIEKIAKEAGESDVASESITPEMCLKMYENSPLRSFRNFDKMPEEMLLDLKKKLEALTEEEEIR